MLSLELCHAWNILALLVPKAGPVFVYVYTQRMMQKSLHTLLLLPLGCVSLTPTFISQSVSQFSQRFSFKCLCILKRSEQFFYVAFLFFKILRHNDSSCKMCVYIYTLGGGGGREQFFRTVHVKNVNCIPSGQQRTKCSVLGCF
jgi:hypothetical protein